MSELHNYGLVRFSKKTGKIDTTMTAIGKGLIQMWALQNTSKTKACVIVDIDERRPYAEYVGKADGFPEVRKDPATFEYDLPEELFGVFAEEIAKRNAERAPLANQVQNAEKKTAAPTPAATQGQKSPEKEPSR